MKKALLAICTLVLMIPGANVFAQGKYGADSAECIKYLSYYSEYYKQKNYDEALPNWRKAYKLCPPTANQNLFVHGTTLMKRVISAAKTPEAQQAAIDSLFMLYDVRAEYYPKNAVTAINNKGLDMSNYIKNNPEKLHAGLTEIIETLKSDTKPSIFVNNLNTAIDLFRQDKLTAEDVINIYQSSIAYLSEETPDTEAEIEAVNKVKTDIESLFISSKVASCDNLIALFTPRFDANPNDLDVVSNIVKMMGITEGCTNNDLYFNAATNMYKLNPSVGAAYALYKLNSSRGDYDEAVRYIEEAIASEDSDTATDANYYYELAVYCLKSGKQAKAYESAQKALELDSTLAGKANLLMANIWGTGGCGGDEIAKRAPYWVAVDYLNKAKAADASLTEECNKLIGSYSAYFPATADAFMYDITNGQSYTVSCNGMRATTIVRTNK